MAFVFEDFEAVLGVPLADFAPLQSLTIGAFDYTVAPSDAADYQLVLSNGLKLYTAPSETGALTSRQLNWQANDTITAQLQQLVESGALSGGAELLLQDDVIFNGHNFQFPDDFTLSAENGARLIVDDSQDFIIGDDNDLYGFTFLMGQNTTFKNVDIVWIDTPPEGVKSEVHGILVENATSARVIGSRFEGNIEIFIDFADSQNVEISDSYFHGAYYQVRLRGVDGASITSSTFDSSLGDGIKTALGSNGTRNVTVTSSLFIENNRDGIDTTGGFMDSVVRDSYFVANRVSGLDIKTIYRDGRTLITDPLNSNILIENTEFINHTNAIVLTTLDRNGTLTAGTVQEGTVHDITLRDSLVFRDENAAKVFFVKDGHSASGENVTLLGNIDDFRELTDGTLTPHSLSLDEGRFSEDGSWTLLSDYRSIAAHGEVAEFQKVRDTGDIVSVAIKNGQVVEHRLEEISGDILSLAFDDTGALVHRGEVDGSDAKGWQTRDLWFDEWGQKQRVDVLSDHGWLSSTLFEGGVRTEVVMTDATNVRSWEVQTKTYGPTGQLISTNVQFDDGRVADVLFEGGVRASSSVVDVEDAFVWRKIDVTFDETGAKLSARRENDDGLLIETLFDEGQRSTTTKTDVDDVKNWQIQETNFDADGSAVSRYTLFDDGSEATFVF